MLLGTAAQNNAYQRTEKSMHVWVIRNKQIEIVACIVCAIKVIPIER